MKRFMILCTLCLVAGAAVSLAPFVSVKASPAAVSQTVDEEIVGHIKFIGVEVKGDIYEFSKALKKNGAKITKRMGDSDQYAMRGTVYGAANCDFLVSYTPNSRTVYRVMARPKHINVINYLHLLELTYGSYADYADETYKWVLPNGMVMFKVPDGYDPTLLIIDAAGFTAYQDESGQKQMR
ncbi:MAG: hypothetical protein K6F94_06920 [Bacteroidaceae bacterium]|nr:hypothetical protein [Bacteroidaceae bacterium]